MKLKIFYNKSVPENANFYYEKAKKLKKKLPGVEKTIEKTKKELEELEQNYENYIKKKKIDEKILKNKEKKWYEKFRYTYTSLGNLVVIGKDASSNEIIIKKYSKKDDLIIHSEAPGSPFGIIRLENKNKEIKEEEIYEAGQFLLSFSKYWKEGYGVGDFFCVKQEQVSKKAPSGEFIGKGSFMIYGEKKIFKNVPLRICLGYIEEIHKIEDETFKIYRLSSGTEKSCKKHCKKYIILEPGNENYKSLTKKIKKQLKVPIDDLPKYIPNKCKIVKK